MFLEEKNAIELDKKLGKLFKNKRVSINKTLNRAGVNSSCDVESDNLKIHICCFDKNEYYLELSNDDEVISTGRTYVEGEVLSIALIWLTGGTREYLYDKYPFIDKTLREFDSIKRILSKSQSEFVTQIRIDAIHRGCDIYELELHGENRHCRLYFYGEEEIPRIEFYWSGTYLFRVNTNNYELLALVFVRWLVEEISPSNLEKEFTWVSTGELAKYYEQGRGIEGEFIISWLDTLEFYSDDDEYCIRAVEFIRSLQKQGYDHTLRAGQSMHTFILSRSRRHGLQEDQPYIAFDFPKEAIWIRSNLEPTEIHESNYRVTDRIEELLDKLVATPIS